MKIIYDYVSGCSLLDFEGNTGVQHLNDFFWKKCKCCGNEERKSSRLRWRKSRRQALRVGAQCLNRKFDSEELAPFISKWAAKLNRDDGVLFISIIPSYTKFMLSMAHVEINTDDWDEPDALDFCGDTKEFNLPRKL